MSKKTFKLNGLKPSLGKANDYASFFESMVESMRDDIDPIITAKAQSIAMDSAIGDLIEASLKSITRKWQSRFNKVANDWAKKIVLDQDRDAELKMGKEVKRLKIPNGFSFKAGDLTNRRIKQRAREISKLVKSIPSDYINDLSEMIGGYGVESPKISVIHEMLDSRYKKHKNKAKNLMLDQTRKTFQGLTEARAIDSGQNKYEWLHVGGSVSPRSYHKFVLNGKTFTFDKPPVIDRRTGERGHPGDAINCKCIKRIIVEF